MVLPHNQSRWSSLFRVDRRVELRSSLLRFGVASILVATLLVDKHPAPSVHTQIVATYGAVTVVALLLAWLGRSPVWLYGPLATVDAVLVVMLFHEHLFVDNIRQYELTATNFSVAFVLLLHAALSLQPRIIIIFASVVMVGWLGFDLIERRTEGNDAFRVDVIENLHFLGVPALAFISGVLMVLMLIRDHRISLARAVDSERQKGNLQRFFAPAIAGEIAAKGLSLGLSERQVSVMFVDLRSFTRFAEGANADQLSRTLSEFRGLVAENVFAHGGTIDKFMGDAVLAVFGVPVPSSSDRANAIACAQNLTLRLQVWETETIAAGRPALKAGIGLHHGTVLFGVIDSGRHAELTVLGDIVNVAQRLEAASKSLDASIVASDIFSSEITRSTNDGGWRRSDGMVLPGRLEVIDAWFLPRKLERGALYVA